MIEMLGRDSGTFQTRLREAVSSVTQKLAERGSVVAAASVVTLLFVMFGGLSVRAGLAGAAALLAWASLWPSRASWAAMTERDLRRRLADASRSSGGALWMAVIDSLPDPALALDAGGDVVAINASASELFGSADPGRHISQVTRAPELLAAVDSALETGETQECRLDFKDPVERRLDGTVAP